ncbi:S8 family serine peptidase [Kitasatospora sp. MBT66]|uniref:S8 family serine peptidase n=1 Tax=Kitasatospora sp. MBT66 TaxID=1444769 RepID=UPI0006EB6FA7|nr:S8 family serine peptidase [Kitasatospora sp. MBT66]
MNPRTRSLVVAAAAAAVLTAIPVGISPLSEAAPSHVPASASASAEEAGPVDPPLFDSTRNGRTVRVNVVTDRRTDLASATDAGPTLVSYDTLPMVTLRVGQEGLRKLNTRPGVVSVTEDVPVPPTLNESTVKIGSDRAFAAGKTGAGTAVAILDTGVAVDHPFLSGRVKTQACFSVNDEAAGVTSLCPDGSAQQEGDGSADAGSGPCASLGAECSHGTHVAGIAAGNGAGTSGAPVRGVAPGADIIAVQVFSRFSSDEVCWVTGTNPCVLSYTSSQLKGLEKVLALKRAGTDVVAANLSLGAGHWTAACTRDPLAAVIDALRAAGVATVVAAGNSGDPDAVSSPGCVPSAITVGATTDDDQLAAFSNRGALLDLLAPGTSIVSSVPGGYASMNGTSMAAPHVTGALAVLRQTYPGLSIDQLEALLKNDGKPIAYTGGTTPRIQLDRSAVPAAPGDMTGDRKPDLVAVDDTGKLRLYPGTGTGGLGPHIVIGAGGWSGASVTHRGDWTGDGKEDIVARVGSQLRVYPNLGDGTLGAPIQIASGLPTTAQVVAVGDTDHDGKPDLVVQHTDKLFRYPGAVVGTAPAVGAPVVIGTTGWDVMDLSAPGDADHDGRVDLLARDTRDGILYHYMGQPDGKSFSSRTEYGHGYTTAYRPLIAGAADADRNGTADMWATAGDGTLRFYQGGTSIHGPIDGPSVQVGNGGWGAIKSIG